MKLLRDLRESTKVLVLLEVTTQRHGKLKTLAEKFGMTIQGISDYVRMMEREGLLRMDERGFHPTREGVEFLHESLRELDAFARDARAQLSVIERCSAIAGATVGAGEPVGLFMERGVLVAYPGRNSTSTGTALTGARRGEAVAVGNLRGIVDLHPGSITIIKIPGAARGSAPADAGHLARLAAGRKIAVQGPEPLAAVSAAGLAADIPFGAIPASIDAAQRGVEVALIVAENEVSAAVAAIEAANDGSEESIPYEVIRVRAQRGPRVAGRRLRKD